MAFGQELAGAISSMSLRGHVLHTAVPLGLLGAGYGYEKHKGSKHPIIMGKVLAIPGEAAMLGGIMYGAKHGESLAARIFMHGKKL